MAWLSGVDAARTALSEQGAAGPSASARLPQVAPQSLPGGIRLRIFQPTGRVYAEILEPGTREVTRTVPPMELLRVTARLQQALGLLVDREG